MVKKRLSSLALPCLAFLLTVACVIFFGVNSEGAVQGLGESTLADTSKPGQESVFSDKDILFSFVVIGCNRADQADIALTAPSTANLEQLERTFTEVAQLSPPPKFLFFAGDLVYGYTSNAVTLKSELEGWRELYESSPLASTQTTLVPIPGNHEVQNENKVAYEEAERTWLSVMAPYLKYAGNGPHASEEDQLKTDQSSLTYSFNYKNTHFVLLNTDPVGKDWSVPTNWIAKDLAQARSRLRIEHIFAIGHKPAYAYPTNLYNPPITAEDGLGRYYPADRDKFWVSLVSNQAEAMLAAHDHLYYRTKGPNGDTWQIIAGNGGSKLESVVNQASINYYGFTVVTVLKNGNVTVTSYGRDVPTEGYLAPSSAYPTTVRDQADITWSN